MDHNLDQLRARAEELMRTQPAETTPEMSWLVQELGIVQQILLDLVDYLILKEAAEEPE